MKVFAIFLICLFINISGPAKTVAIDKARILADNYFSSYNKNVSKAIANSFSVDYNSVTVYHVFNYEGGGFVVIAADDAVTPVLAQSNEGYIDQEISNPAAKYWFDSYSKEIAYIIASNPDNTETLKEWNQIRNKGLKQTLYDAGPLLTTTWDQAEWYNYYCPVDAGGPGGRVPAGCVATAMAQIMKYYNFPKQGFQSHSYEHRAYGIQKANFGDSTYQWQLMGNSANGSNFHKIASLLYQVGISVDMNYNISGSGASHESVLWAMPAYFNYDASTISISKKEDYTDNEWKELLKAEIHALQPLYYAGYDATLGGHAWVCDGWRWSDDMFHMNWGWSGSLNGWFRIGQLNTSQGRYNNTNVIVKGIRPGNPNLVVRITNLIHNQLIACNSTSAIDCSVLKGTAAKVNVYFDNALIHSTSQSNFTYNLSTAGYAIGNHTIKVEAINSTDTSYYKVNIRNSEWISQASAFSKPSFGISHIHAVDSLVAWATAYDGFDANSPLQVFTRTINGGETWTPGIIPNCSGLTPSMIFALNADTAYCPMFWQSGTNPQGIYVTKDGGINWSRQATATFSDAASFPNVVHFFDNRNGFCMGDPTGGDFDIYTTDNGGTTWTRVAAENIPDPVADEIGVTDYYSAIGNKAWFGTSKGRVYRTSDRGHHWDVNTTTLSGKYIDVEFADQFHGLAQDKSTNSTGALSETFDGGVTWTPISIIGTIGTNDFCFVPGTENTWVSTGTELVQGFSARYGVFYSIDGGHSWVPFMGNEIDQMNKVDFVSPRTGWAGGFNASATAGGMFKFIGLIQSKKFLAPVSSLHAVVTGKSIRLEWNAPASETVSGYNLYRNDTLLTVNPVSSKYYNDINVSYGKHTYCVVAVYTDGKSEAACIDASVLSPVKNLSATVLDYRDVKLEWNTPVTGVEIRYNVFRNSILLNSNPLNRMYYLDEPPYNSPLTGKQTYCLVAVYPSGNSEPECTDVFMPSPVTNLTASVTGRNVLLEWNSPASENFLGFNVFRNDTKLNEFPIQSSSYSDNQVTSGKQTYCVLAIFTTGFSELVCTDAWIMTDIPENKASLKIYPNPTSGLITIETPVNFSHVSILNQLGQEVYSYYADGNKLVIPTVGLKRGIFVLKIRTGNIIVARKISIY
ncbi:MAG: C10 family peptidase [Bacteroidales bacterium]|nr:C10 family peptidase [Bacteroidales bacterium]